MDWAFWLVLAIAAGVLITSAAIAGGSPSFWWGMGTIAFGKAFPAIIAAFRPASAEELARQKKNTDRGEEAGAVGNGPSNPHGRGKE
jgi:hypothetical protein